MHIFDVSQIPASRRKLRYVPEKSAFLSEYLSLALPRGVTTCLVVQPSFLGVRNEYIANSLNHGETSPEIFGVAVVSPEISREELQLLCEKGYRGIRWNLVQEPEEVLDFSSPLFHDLWDSLNALEMHVEIHVEGFRLMRVLEQIVPRLNKVVIDHFMRPYDGCEGTKLKVPNLYRDMKRYVDLEKIWVKVSGAYRVFPEMSHQTAVEYCSDLAAMLTVMLEKDRILWGSDWPCTQNDWKIEGETLEEKYATLRNTREIWSREGVFFDPDKAFDSLIGKVKAKCM